MPKLSVIIPTLNRGSLFHNTVRQVLQQPFDDFELIIVDQSDPEAKAANEAFVRELADPRVQYLHLSVRGLPNARNEGMARATGEIWLFLDDDVMLLGDVLGAHVRVYDKSTVGGVTGRTIERSIVPNIGYTRNCITRTGRILYNLLGTQPCQVESLKGANMSFRAQACQKIGGFDRAYKGNALLEEADFSERIRQAGWELWFEPEAELLHLSALQGGVRVENAIETEYWRFRNTCYWVVKHRGPLALAPVVPVFLAIALKKSMKWQSFKGLQRCLQGFMDGWNSWKTQGPDQKLPSL